MKGFFNSMSIFFIIHAHCRRTYTVYNSHILILFRVLLLLLLQEVDH